MAIYFVDVQMEFNEIQKRESDLRAVHHRTIAHLKTSLEKFATFSSSVRGFIEYSEHFPSENKLQSFVNRQLQDIDGYDSLIISYIDTAFIFQYAFNRYKINPTKLKGRSVRDIRSEEHIEELRERMLHTDIRLLDPINLIEGWVGIPIDFGVVKNGQTSGFVACLINFKNIINDAYQANPDAEFVFRFMTSKGIDFDREAVYDGHKIHNQAKDSLFYKNFDIEESAFVFSEIELYGLGLTIGTAYQKPYARNQYFSFLMYSWYVVLILFSLVVMRRLYFYRQMSIESGSANQLLREGNKLLQNKSQDIQTQNTKLNELIHTKNKFFAIISHDVKSPLNSIIGLLQLLKDQKFEDDGIQEIVGHLTSSTQNTIKLLENLLSWAQLQTGDITYQPAMIDLKGVIEESIQLKIENAEQKKIQLTSEINSGIAVHADRNMILTVTRNIISNSIKFTKPGGQVKVSCIDDVDQVTIAIADSGVGIPQKDVVELFTLDGKVKTQGTEGEKGTGLGLILSKEFIDRHNGTVWVESEVGIGTTFYFTLQKNAPE